MSGRVELNQAPGSNGVTVKLESSNPQLAAVPPQVIITQGVTSSETGAMFKATFPITTQPVQEDTTVVIKARVGVQTLQASLRIQRPKIKSLSVEAPYICDGDNKMKISYELTGPAPSELSILFTAKWVGRRAAQPPTKVGTKARLCLLGIPLAVFVSDYPDATRLIPFTPAS